MALTENHMDEIQSRLAHIRRKQLSGDRIYNFLIAFDKLYDKLSDAEKKEFMGTFVVSIDLVRTFKKRYTKNGKRMVSG